VNESGICIFGLECGGLPDAAGGDGAPPAAPKEGRRPDLRDLIWAPPRVDKAFDYNMIETNPGALEKMGAEPNQSLPGHMARVEKTNKQQE